MRQQQRAQAAERRTVGGEQGREAQHQQGRARDRTAAAGPLARPGGFGLLGVGSGHAGHVGEVAGDQRQAARGQERDRPGGGGHGHGQDQRTAGHQASDAAHAGAPNLLPATTYPGSGESSPRTGQWPGQPRADGMARAGPGRREWPGPGRRDGPGRAGGVARTGPARAPGREACGTGRPGRQARRGIRGAGPGSAPGTAGSHSTAWPPRWPAPWPGMPRPSRR